MHALTRARWAHDLTIVEDACQAHGADARRAARRGDRASPPPSASTRRRTSARSATPARSSRPTTRAGEADARAARARAAGEVRPRARGLHGSARHDPGARALAQAAAARRVERAAAGGGRASTTRHSPASATSNCLPVPAGSDPVWHLFVVRTADRDGARRDSSPTRGIATGAPLPGAASPLAGVSPGSGTRAAPSRSPSALASELLSLPIFPGIDRRADRARRRARSATSSLVADCAGQRRAVPTDRRRRVRRGRRRPAVHEPLRLPDRRRDADRAVRRDPARRHDRRALQDPEPHLHLRRRRPSRTRSSSATASMFVNDKLPRATTRRRRAAEPRRLGAAADGRRARRLDRLRRGRPRRRSHRRAARSSARARS